MSGFITRRRGSSRPSEQEADERFENLLDAAELGLLFCVILGCGDFDAEVGSLSFLLLLATTGEVGILPLVDGDLPLVGDLTLFCFGVGTDFDVRSTIAMVYHRMMMMMNQNQVSTPQWNEWMEGALSIDRSHRSKESSLF